jgi:hypothetical protein
MFLSSSCPSSGATTAAVAAFGLQSELGDSSPVGRGWAGRPNHDQQHCYYQAQIMGVYLRLAELFKIMSKIFAF